MLSEHAQGLERDTDLAVEVRERDVEVDHIYNAVFFGSWSHT